MKKIIVIAVCGLLALSCSRDYTNNAFGGKMTVNINTCDLQLTKADTDDPYNENLIEAIDFYIYKGDDTTAAYRHGHLSTSVYHTKSFIIDFTAAEYATLFSGSDDAIIYAVVNMPESTQLSGTGLKDIREALLTADFVSSATQDWFVMSGQATLAKNETSITIDVARVAAKLSIDITTNEYCLEDPEDSESTKWYSHPEAIKVEFANIFNKAMVSGKTDGCTVTATDIDSVPESAERDFYYTYPRKWEYGSDFEPYFFITMPVTKDSLKGETVRYCYYKIVLPGKSFERNHWYDYDISLKMLGSFERDIPTVETPDNVRFYVHTWGGYNESLGNETNGEITGIKYLEVAENAENKIYYMYNQEQMTIPFVSSDDCRIQNITASSLNFSNASSVTTTNRTSEVSVTISGGEIVIRHPLNNNITPGQNFDYSPVTISFEIQHNTGSSSDTYYKESITVVQYPAMYISVERTTAGSGSSAAYLFVNNNKNSNSKWTNVEGLGSGSGGSSNPNMYVINVTRFSTDDYIIGDPRTDTPKTAAQIGFSDPSAQTDANGRSLTYYYGTQDDESKANVIAPSYRICSGYGRLGSVMLSHTTAYYRCAAYQEEGRPAGRWRLPTTAELRFIATLCATGKIPPLFTNNNDYFSATGIYTYSSSGGGSFTESSGSGYVRCVYDDWYWNNSDNPVLTDKSRFIWGDEQR